MTKAEINRLVEALSAHFLKAADPEEAPGMMKYMKNKFEFYGLKKAAREAATKSFWEQYKQPETAKDLQAFVEALWEQPYRELHYLAMQLLEKPLKKADATWVPFLEYLIVNNSWWDTVDCIAASLLGPYLKRYPELVAQYPDKWIASDNMWLRRTAILYQLKYKKDTDTERLFDYILHTAQEKEFFIQKVQGWTLREYAKTNPQAVGDFVEEHKAKLSNLTKREALKHFD